MENNNSTNPALVASQNAAGALIAAGVTAMVGAVIATAVGTVKAVISVTRYAEENGIRLKEIPKKKLLKVAGKYYILPTVLTALSATCTIIGFNKECKNVALVGAAAGIVTDAAVAYQDKVVEVLGEKADQKVRQAIADEEIEAPKEEKTYSETTKLVNEDDIAYVDTGLGHNKMYEPLTNTYFIADLGIVRQKAAKLAQDMVREGYGSTVSLADFLYEIHIPCGQIGELVGWSIDDNGIIDIDFVPHDIGNNVYINSISYKRLPTMI